MDRHLSTPSPRRETNNGFLCLEIDSSDRRQKVTVDPTGTSANAPTFHKLLLGSSRSNFRKPYTGKSRTRERPQECVRSYTKADRMVARMCADTITRGISQMSHALSYSACCVARQRRPRELLPSAMKRSAPYPRQAKQGLTLSFHCGSPSVCEYSAQSPLMNTHAHLNAIFSPETAARPLSLDSQAVRSWRAVGMVPEARCSMLQRRDWRMVKREHQPLQPHRHIARRRTAATRNLAPVSIQWPQKPITPSVWVVGTPSIKILNGSTGSAACEVTTGCEPYTGGR